MHRPGSGRAVVSGAIKRAFDVCAAAVALVALAPVLLAVALLVRMRLGAPVLFRQTRPGLHGRPFGMIKFRSMTDARAPDGSLKADADRLTEFGRFLRASSLDELPGLWNVLRGEMSLVGPRPLLMQYLPLYTARQARRHDVRPGITGLAQVEGRNSLTWSDKFELDVRYVDSRSFLLDLQILWRTVAKVLRRDGVSADGHVTMPVFTGDPETSR